MTYELLRNQIVQTRPDIDINAVDQAYEFANKYHQGQKRYSGEDYIIHPVAATSILMRLNPDLFSIQACLLHDVTEDTDATVMDVEKHFGVEVAELVSGLEKLAVIKIRDKSQQEEKWRNMFLAMAKDIRIVFIKLADRLHNMQTLMHVPKEKQQRIARETLIVHASVASRLGIYQIKAELEDLCFKYLFPEEFEDLFERMSQHHDRSCECMDFATSRVEQLLAIEGIEVERVDGRLKHLWSIFQKMKRYDTSDLKDIYDFYAVRVILPDRDSNYSHLYEVLGLIHNQFIPLQDRFKDYVALPKPNGYRSLHTTVAGLGGDLYEEPTEIQIRTLTMHMEAEIGVASHWSYKSGKKSHRVVDRERHFALRNSLKKVNALVDANPDLEGIVKEWIERYQHMQPTDRSAVEKALIKHGLSEEDLIHIRVGRSQEALSLQPDIDAQLVWLRGLADEENVRSDLDLFPERIFVLTPQSDVIELSKGSTPIDFAYAIHTEVGNKLVHAKVNGKIVPLDYELKNGEMVEIGTRTSAQPNRYWLSIAKTASAKAKIKNWFNKQDRDANIAVGRDLLNAQLELIGQPLLDDKYRALKNYAGKERDYFEREQILESIGLGVVTVQQIIRTLHPYSFEKEDRKEVLQVDLKDLSEKVLVTGEEDLPVILSACCKPKPPGPIIGYVTRGRAIRVHRQSCQELSGLEGERFVSAHWKTI